MDKNISLDELQDIFESALVKAEEEFRNAVCEFGASSLETASKNLTYETIRVLADSLDEYRDSLLLNGDKEDY